MVLKAPAIISNEPLKANMATQNVNFLVLKIYYCIYEYIYNVYTSIYIYN